MTLSTTPAVASDTAEQAEPSLAGRTEFSVAEAIALRCRQHGIRKAFAYPGTSELALCHAFSALSDGTLVNARGDSEAAFMAGASGLAGKPEAVAIVHAARGLTNAAGAVADLRRNELPALVIVGLPSTRSAEFLPPHGEDGLVDAVGTFAKASLELAWPSGSETVDPVGAVDTALDQATALPGGPVLLGVPQDILEARAVPTGATDRSIPPAAARLLDGRALHRARRLLSRAARPVILIDDYLLRHQDAEAALIAFAEAVDAVIFQVRYRRGPMLFQQLTSRASRRFAGGYDPANNDHRTQVAGAGLLITVEDRNLYHRVVGRLPDCPKIAITSDADKTTKNGYLSDGDVVVEGDPVTALGHLAADLTPAPAPAALAARKGHQEPDRRETARPSLQVWLQDTLAQVVSGCLSVTGARLVIDDSQMVGGVLANSYNDAFGDAGDLTVLGDHAGFVGAGIPIAAGLAITQGSPVLCLLGDQGFTNGSQGLVCAAQEAAPVLFVVCNNGESVSLRTQAAQLGHGDPTGDFARLLRNAPEFSYVAAAWATGIAATLVDLRPDQDQPPGANVARQVIKAAGDLWSEKGPALLELRLPGTGPAWDGIWVTHGYDETGPRPAPAAPSSVPVGRSRLAALRRRVR